MTKSKRSITFIDLYNNKKLQFLKSITNIYRTQGINMEIKYDKEKKALGHYERNLNYFDKNKLLNASMSLKTFKNIIKKFDIKFDELTILDFGAGTGETSLYLLNEYNIKNLTAIDYSKKRIDSFIKESSLFDNVTVLNEDVNLFLENNKNLRNTFDVIISFEIIEHLSNPIEIIKELKKLLKVNGKLIGTIPLQNKPNDVHLSAFRTITEIETKLNVKVFNEFTLRFPNQLVFYYKK